MDRWKESFLKKLSQAQNQCGQRFEDALDQFVEPAFQDIGGFLRDNGFQISKPLSEEGRRSYKFELAENAYQLVIFRFSGIGEFELRTETFVPGADPKLEKSVCNVADIDESWAAGRFQSALDAFVEQLGNSDRAVGRAASADPADEELVVV
ncbi:MAG: hypothetical protein D6744_11560 [Planctomycetota bacterium]|nr:MAG: hypothetical protein D6744_11560 [Planctomycetota bacterium]